MNTKVNYEDLLHAIGEAADAAYEESTVEEDVDYDVRLYEDGSIRAVLHEQEDGGRVLASKVEPWVTEEDVAKIMADLED